MAQDDYGYWYAPDGRTAEQQAEFFKVEVKPQALEWIFCVTAGMGFRLSVDNLSGEALDIKPFAEAVFAQLGRYIEEGVPSRAGEWINELALQSKVDPFDTSHYSLEALI